MAVNLKVPTQAHAFNGQKRTSVTVFFYLLICPIDVHRAN